jgi:serine/threonine-protein kinase
MTLGAGAVFAGYTIVRMLGSGGMGEVFLAQHPRLPRTEALKLLKPEISTDETFRARFIREADSIAALDHPNIVTVYDRGDTDGTLWIATQYIDGTDAGQLMKDRYPAGMPVEEALAITTAIAEALDYAHDRGLVHRDVKPANILLSQRNHEGDRRIFLADFGIARTLDDSAGLTATNFTVGTFAYAAPEQLMGEAIDGRADQYALAATTYHLLTGITVFPASNPVVASNHHLNSPAPLLSSTRHDLVALDPILAKALSKDPADRYTRCTDFARALTAHDAPRLAESTSVGPTMQAPTPPPKSPRREQQSHPVPPPTAPLSANKHVTKAMWVAAAAVGVALAALALVWTQRQPTTISAPEPPTTTPVVASPATRPSTSTQTVTKTVLPSSRSAATSAETTTPVRAPVRAGTITGTCDEGSSCGVKQRNAPRNAAPGITSQPLLDGTRVGIVCQTIGDTRQNSGYGASNLWYQITNGAYIPAVYMTTGTEVFPQC